MSIVTVKRKYQVVIPQTVRKKISVNVGDVFDARVERGKIVLHPKVIVDRDEYTRTQRRRIDAQLSKSIAEDKRDESIAFDTPQEMIDYLHQKTSHASARQESFVIEAPNGMPHNSNVAGRSKIATRLNHFDTAIRSTYARAHDGLPADPHPRP